MKTSLLYFAPSALVVASALLLTGCDNDEKAQLKTSTATSPRAISVATTPAPAAKALDSELMTPAEVPQPPAPPAPADPLVSSTPAIASGEATPLPPAVRTPVAPTEAVEPLSKVNAWEEIKDYTYAQKAELVASVKMMTSEFDTATAALRAGSPKPEFADTRFSAVSALEDARVVLAQKRESLENASAETWQSAKAEFRSTWKNAMEAYDKAKMMSN